MSDCTSSPSREYVDNPSGTCEDGSLYHSQRYNVLVEAWTSSHFLHSLQMAGAPKAETGGAERVENALNGGGAAVVCDGRLRT